MYPQNFLATLASVGRQAGSFIRQGSSGSEDVVTPKVQDDPPNSSTFLPFIKKNTEKVQFVIHTCIHYFEYIR